MLSGEVDISDKVVRLATKKLDGEDGLRKEGRDLYIHLKPVKRKDGTIIDENVVAAAKGIRSALTKMWNDGNNIKLVGGVIDQEKTVTSLFQNWTKRVLNYFPRHYIYENIEPNRGPLEELIIKYGHADMRTEKVTREGMEVLELEDGIHITDPEDLKKFIEVNEKTIDQKVFGDYLEGEEGFEALARRKLKGEKASDEQILIKAKELKAKAIVQQMLDRKNKRVLPSKKPTNSGGTFLQHRAFYNIPDDD